MQKEPSNETRNTWHKDPENWKLDIFYYNKADKRIFAPKRICAFGVTINFANPYSILAFFRYYPYNCFYE